MAAYKCNQIGPSSLTKHERIVNCVKQQYSFEIGHRGLTAVSYEGHRHALGNIKINQADYPLSGYAFSRDDSSEQKINFNNFLQIK